MRRRSKEMTADIAAQIKRLWKTTEMAQHEIAATLGINQGRVSEVLSGKRFSWVSIEQGGNSHA